MGDQPFHEPFGIGEVPLTPPQRRGRRSSRIQQISRDKLQIQQGSLYPALYRLEHQGLITSEWGESDNNRRAKYYQLTGAGRRRLQKELAYWRRLSEAIELVLSAVPKDV